MSSKQMARTVLDGKKVTFDFGFTSVEGYLCGMDDFHWMVVTPEGQQHLIHKGQTPLISFSSQPTYDGEPQRRTLEKIIGPFRSRLADIGVIPRRAVPATPEGLTA
jgi:hypothetical protein